MTDDQIQNVILAANDLLTVRIRARAHRRETAGDHGDGWSTLVQDKLSAFVGAMKTALTSE